MILAQTNKHPALLFSLIPTKIGPIITIFSEVFLFMNDNTNKATSKATKKMNSTKAERLLKELKKLYHLKLVNYKHTAKNNS